MSQIKYGLGFILALAVLLTASSLFFRDRHAPEAADILNVASEQPQDGKTKAQEVESISNEKGVNEETLDGENTNPSDETIAEEPEAESSLENVFVNLTQEMAKRGYAKGLSVCIESQFRENQGIENPKDLDAMLRICDSQFQVDPKQSQQIREVVLQAIAKAQTKTDEF